MRIRSLICAGLMAALPGVSAVAQTDDATKVMYGFDREAGTLVRHVVGSGESEAIGSVQTEAGQVLTGIDGAAYIPPFQQIFAFWTDPDSQEGRFVYVDIHDAGAVLAEKTVEGGRITGAVAVPEDGRQVIYAVQLAETTPPEAISGVVRLNPNNSHHMQFDLDEIDENGNVIREWTRDDLLNATGSDVDGNGTLIEGFASYFRIRPIGQGGQRDIQLGGETITLENSNTYIFTSSAESPMKVRVYNAKPNGNKLPMGHWYLEILGGTAIQGEEAEVVTPRRLVRVTHKDEVEINDLTGEEHEKPVGTVNELFTLNHDYDGLAYNQSEQMFYATSGTKLYRIDPITGAESEALTLAVDKVFGLEFVTDEPMAFEIGHDRLGTFNLSTGNSSLLTVAGLRKLGSIVLCDLADDPNEQRSQLVSYD